MNNLKEKYNFLREFKGKKVFITGHTGFKGSWLAYILHECGAIVRGFSLRPVHQDSHYQQLGLPSLIDSQYGDITDSNSLIHSIESFQPEYVFHLAAQALVKQAYDDPFETFNTNIIGSVNLLEAVKRCNSIRSLVYITSDKCYENNEWIWGYRETDKLGGRDPYSASKAAAEIIFSSFYRSFLSDIDYLGAATARAGNVIGGGDWAENRIIPDCIRAFNNNESVTIRSPYSTRPWQHVLEPLSGYLLLASKLYDDPKRFAGAWNFGPSVTSPLNVEEVTLRAIKHYGKGDLIIQEPKNGFHEANLLQLNCDKAYQLLDWKPNWTTEETIEETITWYKRYHQGESAASITKSQIEKYFSRSQNVKTCSDDRINREEKI